MGTVAPIVRRTHAEFNKSANVGFDRGPFYDKHTVASIDLGKVASRTNKLSNSHTNQEMDVSTDRRGDEKSSGKSPTLPYNTRQLKTMRTSDQMINLMNWQGQIDESGYRFESHYQSKRFPLPTLRY